MSTYIFGHTSPDSDSIIGAISLAYLKNELGEDCIATRQGEISAETEFIINRFGGEVYYMPFKTHEEWLRRTGKKNE